MEWMTEARALKSSFMSEIAMLSAQQVCFDDVCVMANVTCDDFSVDDLLDFSDKDFEDGFFQASEEDEAKHSFSSSSSSSSVSLSHQKSFDDTTSFIQNSDFEPVPVDEMENLEWLSQFVDDSGTGLSLLCPVGSFLENRCEPVTEPAVQRHGKPCFTSAVSKKPRGKRARPVGRLVWSLGSSSSSSMTSESSSITSLSSSCSNQETESLLSVEKPAAKKQKKPEGESGSGRRCCHCQVQKTPQWRTGPLGPKTLCNACGVRYKSGRLFPEYRPACSPTFSQELHSNSHRKVLEMRRTKETVQ